MYVVPPIQFVLGIPAKLFHGVGSFFTTKTELQLLNDKLQQENLALKADLQRMRLLEQDNAALKKLVDSETKLASKAVIAKLLSLDLSGFRQQIMLDKGTHDHLYLGQPVLDETGMVGQVIFLGPNSSRVLLLTDRKSAIPVVDLRNGLQTIVVGTGRINGLEAANITETMDVKVGDELVSSGINQRFPEGYRVGTVTAINNVPGETFAKITVAPASRLYRNRFFLLTWPNNLSAK